MRITAWRGRGAAMVPGSVTGAHLDGAGVSFESFGACKLRDGRRQLRQGRRRQFLNGDDLDEVGRRKAAPQPGRARSRKHMIRARAVVAGSFRTEWTQEDAAGVPDAGQQARIVEN